MTLEPRELWHLPTRHLGRRVHVYERVGSTNDLAAALLTDADAQGDIVLAELQERGRGQSGRSWLSEPGLGVTLSVALHPPERLRRPALLTAWAAVSVSEAIRAVSALSPVIKWPNDVLVNGRKVCGILIEGKGTAAVAGVGLNVNHTREHFVRANLPVAGSLASLTGRSFDYQHVARVLIESLDAEYARLIDGDALGLERRWVEHLGLVGRAVECETTDGVVRRGRLKAMGFDGVTVEGELAVAPERVRRLNVCND